MNSAGMEGDLCAVLTITFQKVQCDKAMQKQQDEMDVR